MGSKLSWGLGASLLVSSWLDRVQAEPAAPVLAAPETPVLAERAPLLAEPSPNASTGARVALPAVVLAVRGDSLDVLALQALLQHELARDVVLESAARPAAIGGVVTVSYRLESAELAVAWDDGEHTITRVVSAPDAPERILRDGALLAGNLVRDQVDALLPRAAPPAPPPQPPMATAAPPDPVPLETRLFTASLFYPLATHHGHAEVSSSFDLNLLYGRVGAIDGLQIGGVNVVTRRATPPAQLSGLQIALFANLVNGEVDGLQLASLFNHARGDTHGAQLTFGANFASGSVSGGQAAWIFNRANDVDGVQLSLVNVARDVDGLQLGLVNVARRMRGVSVGLINIADDIDGVPLAPFSVTRTGGVHPVLWSASSGFGNVGLKLATRRTYTLFYFSYHRAFDVELLGGGFALGASGELGAGFRTELDLSGTFLVAPALSHETPDLPGYHEQLVQPRVRLSLGFRPAKHFGAFVGVAAIGQVRSELGGERLSASVGPEIFGGIEL